MHGLAQGSGEDELILKFGAEAEEVLEEIKALEQEGLLAAEAATGENMVRGDDLLKSLCLNVAHDCNLRCRYCFAGTGKFGGPRGLMSETTGQRAIDFLLEKSGPRKTCEIDFFGGEPLLNLSVVESLVAYGKEAAKLKGKTMSFTLTTNGLLLDQKARDFLNREKMQVVVSLDGRPQVHDRMRPRPGNRPSFAAVQENISQFAASRNQENYYVRGTYTHFNTDFATDVFYLADLGFKEISMEPVIAEAGHNYALTEDDLPLIEQEYRLLAREYLERRRQGRDFNFYHFNLNLAGGPCLPKRLQGCGAGYQYLAVSPAGEIYPCHQFVGQKEYLLGDVWQGIIKPELKELFRQTNVLSKEPCSACWARFYCSGGCHAAAAAKNGAITRPDTTACRLVKARLESAIYVQAELLQASGEANVS